MTLNLNFDEGPILQLLELLCVWSVNTLLNSKITKMVLMSKLTFEAITFEAKTTL